MGDDYVVLYPHGGGRELSTKMHDEWKRDLGREYVAVDALLSELAVVHATAPLLMADQDMHDAIKRAIEVVRNAS